MTEQEGVYNFASFLEHAKAYPKGSIQFEVSLSGLERVSRVDMVLVDPTEKLYLAIIEFKKSGALSILSQAASQIDKYKKSSEFNNKDIPAFIVVPNDRDFSIYKYDPKAFSDDTVILLVSKEDFPTFSQLSFSIQAKERNELDVKRSKILDSTQKRTRLLQGIGKAATAGLVVAVIGTILSIYFTYYYDQTERKTLNEKKSSIDKKLDSIEVAKMIERYKKEELRRDSIKLGGSVKITDKQSLLLIKTLEKQLYNNVKKDLNTNIEGRLKKIEDMLSKEPDKILSMFELKSQIAELRLLNEANNSLQSEKLLSVKEKTDLLNNVTWALFSAIIVALMGVAITYIQSVLK